MARSFDALVARIKARWSDDAKRVYQAARAEFDRDLLPELEVMSAQTYADLNTPTNPAACTCDHEALPIGWHRQFCALKQPPPMCGWHQPCDQCAGNNRRCYCPRDPRSDDDA